MSGQDENASRASLSDSNDTISLYVLSPEGELFEAINVPQDIYLGQLASEFCESRGWPTLDSQRRNWRAVVELVDPEDPDRSKRLRSGQTVKNAGLWNGATLRIFPESIAGCFPAGIRVSLANGRKRFIQDIKIGDLLLSGTPGTNKFAVAEVARVFSDDAQGYLVLNNTLKVTESHPIYANGKWKRAGDLEIGDLLQDQYGCDVELRSIERRSECTAVFNLYLSCIEHTFFAEGILVHNKMLKEAYNVLENLNVYTQAGETGSGRISRQEYDMLRELVENVERELTARQEEIWILEERVKSIEDNLLEMARAFGGISNKLSSEQSVVFVRSERDESPRSLVRLKIDRQLEDFGEADQKALIKSIALQAEISAQDLQILYIISGCVTVVLEMSAEAAAELVRLMYGNPTPELASLGIQKIEVHQLSAQNSVPQIPVRSVNPEDRLRIMTRTLGELEKRAAMWAPGNVPIDLFNRIEELKEQIRQVTESIFEKK